MIGSVAIVCATSRMQAKTASSCMAVSTVTRSPECVGSPPNHAISRGSDRPMPLASVVTAFVKSPIADPSGEHGLVEEVVDRPPELQRLRIPRHQEDGVELGHGDVDFSVTGILLRGPDGGRGRLDLEVRHAPAG